HRGRRRVHRRARRRAAGGPGRAGGAAPGVRGRCGGRDEARRATVPPASGGPAAPGGPRRGGPVTIPLLIDCDPGIDDAVALLLACARPEVRLLGVTTVAGNVGVAATTRNARRVLALAGRHDVPVARGAGRPLVLAGSRDARE